MDLLKIIQLGLSFFDADGNFAEGCPTWQFNYKFNLRYCDAPFPIDSDFAYLRSEDMYAQDSIDMLIRSGIDFTKHEEHGIDVTHFGELLMTSGVILFVAIVHAITFAVPDLGLVLVPEVKWISFHSGYDFGYLLKLLTCSPLPSEESVFFDLLHTYFPYIYDIKYLMLSCDNLKGGLQKVAEDLDVSECNH